MQYTNTKRINLTLCHEMIKFFPPNFWSNVENLMVKSYWLQRLSNNSNVSNTQLID